MNVRYFASIAALTALGAFAAIQGCGGNQKIETPAMEPVDSGPPEPPDAGPPPPKELFDRLGGKEKLSAVVDSIMAGAATNAKLKPLVSGLKGPKLDAFKKGANDFLCEQMKGPCKYEGADTRTTFKKFKVSQGQWDAFIEVLTKALNDNSVGDKEKEDIADLLLTMQNDVMNKK